MGPGTPEQSQVHTRAALTTVKVARAALGRTDPKTDSMNQAYGIRAVGR